jgi:hypothetical protein
MTVLCDVSESIYVRYVKNSINSNGSLRYMKTLKRSNVQRVDKVAKRPAEIFIFPLKGVSI